MPNLLDGNYETQIYNDSNMNGLTFTTNPAGMDEPTSPGVPIYDFPLAKRIHQDEISLFSKVDHYIEQDALEEEVNITDCGKCDFLKEENKYAQSYFEQEYGYLYCCNKDCKNRNKKMRELIDTKSHKCFWVCKNCKRRDNDTHGCSKMLCNTCYFSKDESNNSGRITRARRARAV